MTPRRDVRTQLDPVAVGEGTPQLKVANCRSCEAPIVWCRTRSGKSMPVDADPVERGDFWLAHMDDGVVEAHHVRSFPGKLPDDVDRYSSHFATCPDAARFRSKR